MKKLYYTFFFLLLSQICFAQWVSTNGPYNIPDTARSDITALAVSDSNIIAGIFEGSFPDLHGTGTMFISSVTDFQWIPVYSFHDCQVHAFLTIRNNEDEVGIFAGTIGGILHSTDNGMTWAEANTGLTNSMIEAFTINGSNIYAGSDGGVFLSNDGGINWTTIGLKDTAILALAASNNNIFVGNYSGIFRSTNGGVSWSEINSGLSNKSVISLVASDEKVFAGTNEGGIFLSTNNGTSWNEVNTGLTNTNITCLAISGSNIFAGTENGVFLSTNYGTNWNDISTGLINANISALAVSNEYIYSGTATVWFSGPIGQGVWKRSLSELITSVDYNSIQFPLDFKLSQNYPNPFNPRTTIKYSVPKISQVQIKVFDVLGNEIETLVNEEKPVNTYEITWNAANLPSGVYFYQLKAGDFIETKKMVLIK